MTVTVITIHDGRGLMTLTSSTVLHVLTASLSVALALASPVRNNA